MHYWTRGQWPRAFTRGSLTSRLVADSRNVGRCAQDPAVRAEVIGHGGMMTAGRGLATAPPGLRVLNFFAASSGVERHDDQAPNNPVGLPTGSHLSACTNVVARDGIGPEHACKIRAWGLCVSVCVCMRIEADEHCTQLTPLTQLSDWRSVPRIRTHCAARGCRGSLGAPL